MRFTDDGRIVELPTGLALETYIEMIVLWIVAADGIPLERRTLAALPVNAQTAAPSISEMIDLASVVFPTPA